MNDDLGMTVTVLKVASEYTKQCYDGAREAMAELMDRGDRKTSRDPATGDKLASVSLTDPKPVVSVNEAELTPWMVEHYPALTERDTEIVATKDQLVRMLFEHAPHLLKERIRIRPTDLIEFKAACVALGQPVGPGGEADVPGVEVFRPAPTLTCRLSDGGRESVLQMFRDGRLQLDGSVAPQLEESTRDV